MTYAGKQYKVNASLMLEKSKEENNVMQTSVNLIKEGKDDKRRWSLNKGFSVRTLHVGSEK